MIEIASHKYSTHQFVFGFNGVINISLKFHAKNVDMICTC